MTLHFHKLNSSVNDASFGVYFVFFKNSTSRVAQSPKPSLEKVQLPFPSLPPPNIFFQILLLFLGQAKSRNRNNYITKSLTVLQQSGEESIQISHAARDVPWFHPTWPGEQIISKFPPFLHAHQSPNWPNLWLLSKLLVFPQHPSGQKELLMLSLIITMRNFSKYEHQKHFSKQGNSFNLGSTNSWKLKGDAD